MKWEFNLDTSKLEYELKELEGQLKDWLHGVQKALKKDSKIKSISNHPFV